MTFKEMFFGKKEELPGVPEFKGVKKPSKIDGRKTDLELAKELGIKKPEDFDIFVEEDTEKDEGVDVDLNDLK